MPDVLDGKILHALQLAPRAPFRRIADVLAVSEQTVARRYQALRRDGILRVVGLINPAVHGEAQWVARIRCRPDRTAPLADSLARRPDIAYAHVASGGTEIICIVRSPVESEREAILLQQLPRAAAVLDISVDLLIHRFGTAATADWTGYGTCLDPDQVAQLIARRPPAQPGPPPPPTADDAPLLDALGEDGRATHTHLAAHTGWSTGRVARRLDALEASGTLLYEVESLPEPLGYHLNATLWLRTAPRDLTATGEQLAAHGEVAFAGATSGNHNLMAIVICRDAADFYRYLSTRLATLTSIDSYTVSVRVQRLKQAALRVVHGRLVRPEA
ncbi:Lrp/AsnC family transcriptional regulator [Actinoplanes subtropicus]|uniref:Lrp/AsnC family transcriptional regulator n=1 Tax=Actinoplanes subtropicus TaxID=543632 RepID=UPI0004C46DE5|nr:Lrp/AsnC family transcriptional regulator [Actinoplanes subtropicus]